MRVGDKLYCIKDITGYDIGGSYIINSKGLLFEITKIETSLGLTKIIYVSNPTGVYNEMDCYDINTINKHFITIPELRKQKLEKINGN